MVPMQLNSCFTDPDESDEINDKKKAFVERVGAETKANGLPFSLNY